MYPTLAEVKKYMLIDSPLYDEEIENIMLWTESLIDQYLGRKLELAEHTQEFYMLRSESLQLDNYPVTDVVTLTIDNVDTSMDGFYLDKNTGQIFGNLSSGDIISVVYNGGYDPLPPIIIDCFYGIVDDRYKDYIGETYADVKDVTLFDFGKVSYDTTNSSGNTISYSGVGSSGNVPEPLVNYLGRLDLYKSNIVLFNGGGSR